MRLFGKKDKESHDKKYRTKTPGYSSKEPSSWTTEDVAMWLESLDLGEYKKEFIDNSICGADLIELEEEDLTSINVKKLGHRKKILQNIKTVFGLAKEESVKGDTITPDRTDTNNDSTTSSVVTDPSTYVLKCFNGSRCVNVKINPDTRLSKVKSKIKREMGIDDKISLKYEDADGDQISISKDEHLQLALSACSSRNILKVIVKERNSFDISATQAALLESMIDGVIIINAKGTMLYVNTATCKLFGYDRREMLNQNVKMLMPSQVASEHDRYLSAYLQTGAAKIIGVGRNVIAKRKNESTFPCFLSIGETISNSGEKHTFTGTIRLLSENTPVQPINTGPKIDVMPQFVVLENMLDVVIVINESGNIVFFNRQAVALFHYQPAEVLNKNIKMLMPKPYCDEHDSYLRQYLTTGKQSVIGVGRDIVVQLKDGSLMPARLSVTEHQLNGQRHFTGIIQKLQEKETVEKTALQIQREVLDSLIVPAVIIDQNGIIHGFNSSASQLLGYTLIDVVGRNVKMLMGQPYRDQHDTFLSNYLKLGKKKVIGVGRDVVAQHKNGSAIRVRLSVTERLDGERRIFTGVLQRL